MPSKPSPPSRPVTQPPRGTPPPSRPPQTPRPPTKALIDVTWGQAMTMVQRLARLIGYTIVEVLNRRYAMVKPEHYRW